MTLQYYRPAGTKPYDQRSTQEVAQARKLARKPSRNDSSTIRLYNDEGVCCYCRTVHSSNYPGHGYTIEFSYYGDFIVTTMTFDSGAVTTWKTYDVERWKISQRKSLLES